MSVVDVVEVALTGVLVADDIAVMRRRRAGMALLMVALLIGLVLGVNLILGEDDTTSNSMSSGQPPSSDWRPYSVVAPIDTGINVYHDHFRTDEIYPDWLLSGLGVTKTCSPSFEGTWQERYDADKESCWDTITTCLLYTSPSPRDQRGSRMPSSA